MAQLGGRRCDQQNEAKNKGQGTGTEMQPAAQPRLGEIHETYGSVGLEVSVAGRS